MDKYLDKESIEQKGISINEELFAYIKEIAKWAKFLAILGFIMIGIIVLVAVFAGAIFSNIPEMASIPFDFGAMITIIYLCIALVYFFPIFYLYKFSSKTLDGIFRNDEMLITSGFENLKSCFKFMGIMTIVGLAFYFLAIVLGGIGGLLGSI